MEGFLGLLALPFLAAVMFALALEELATGSALIGACGVASALSAMGAATVLAADWKDRQKAKREERQR